MFGEFGTSSTLVLPDCEYIVSQDLAKKVDYTTTVVHKIVPEVVKNSLNNERVYIFEDVVFRDKQQLRYTELSEYTRELLSSLDLAFNSVLIIDGTGIGEPVFDLYEDNALDPLKIIFSSGNTVSVQRNREKNNWSSSKFGTVSGYIVPKIDLISALQLYIQQGKIRQCTERYKEDVHLQYSSFIGKINTETKHISMNNLSDDIHDDWITSDAMACWYTQHMKKINTERVSRLDSRENNTYSTDPFRENLYD